MEKLIVLKVVVTNDVILYMVVLKLVVKSHKDAK